MHSEEKDVCIELRNIRRRLGLSQKKLAKLLNTTPRAISSHERGERTLEYLDNFAELCGISSEYLLQYIDAKTIKRRLALLKKETKS